MTGVRARRNIKWALTAKCKSQFSCGVISRNPDVALRARSEVTCAKGKTASQLSLRNLVRDSDYTAVAAAFRFLRHHARKPPPANSNPGESASTMRLGTLRPFAPSINDVSDLQVEIKNIEMGGDKIHTYRFTDESNALTAIALPSVQSYY
jgi:hypothetical protein